MRDTSRGTVPVDRPRPGPAAAAAAVPSPSAADLSTPAPAAATALSCPGRRAPAGNANPARGAAAAVFCTGDAATAAAALPAPLRPSAGWRRHWPAASEPWRNLPATAARNTPKAGSRLAGIRAAGPGPTSSAWLSGGHSPFSATPAAAARTALGGLTSAGWGGTGAARRARSATARRAPVQPTGFSAPAGCIANRFGGRP
jgi:hypothetical protein